MINFQSKEKIAVVTKERKYTYGELLQLIDTYSQLFSGKNYERVAIYSENRVDWIAAFYAGWRNNCEIVPIDFMSSRDDISYILNDCKPNILFASPELRKKVDEFIPQVNHQIELV